MTPDEFARSIDGFDGKSLTEKVRLFGWYLHVHENEQRFTGASVLGCFRAAHLDEPGNVRALLSTMVEREKPELLKDSGGYRLARHVRDRYDAAFGVTSRVVQVSALLTTLPDQIPRVAGKAFLEEAVTCYRHGAFRAAIVMCWNLAYDHLVEWLLADPVRLASFNKQIPLRYQKKTLVVAGRSDFEDLKESEVIEVVGSASLCSGNIIKVLREKLTKRNMAAHPSAVVVTQLQAEDVATDLVHNVILALR